MPISDFRKKKLFYIFNVFFDVNQSGTIEQKDFDLAIERICRMRDWSPGESRYEEMRSKLLHIWEGLRQRADANNDEQVSREEWCQLWDDFASGNNAAQEWQQRYMDFMFDLQDTSGDGCIDEDEFTSVCSSYGVASEESSKAFNKFSSNKSIKVTREVFASLWKEYFSSEDPEASGNFIFGKTFFD